MTAKTLLHSAGDGTAVPSGMAEMSPWYRYDFTPNEPYTSGVAKKHTIVGLPAGCYEVHAKIVINAGSDTSTASSLSVYGGTSTDSWGQVLASNGSKTGNITNLEIVTIRNTISGQITMESSVTFSSGAFSVYAPRTYFFVRRIGPAIA